MLQGCGTSAVVSRLQQGGIRRASFLWQECELQRPRTSGTEAEEHAAPVPVLVVRNESLIFWTSLSSGRPSLACGIATAIQTSAFTRWPEPISPHTGTRVRPRGALARTHVRSPLTASMCAGYSTPGAEGRRALLHTERGGSYCVCKHATARAFAGHDSPAQGHRQHVHYPRGPTLRNCPAEATLALAERPQMGPVWATSVSA